MSFLIHNKKEYVTSDLPKTPDYEEAFSNCNQTKIVEELNKLMERWIRIDWIIRQSLNAPSPYLIYYRTELQRILEEDMRRKRLQKLSPNFERKLRQMENRKGHDKALAHVAMSIIRLMRDWGEVYPKKPCGEEEKEDAIEV